MTDWKEGTLERNFINAMDLDQQKANLGNNRNVEITFDYEIQGGSDEFEPADPIDPKVVKAPDGVIDLTQEGMPTRYAMLAAHEAKRIADMAAEAKRMADIAAGRALKGVGKLKSVLLNQIIE